MKRSRFLLKYGITDRLPCSIDNSVIAVEDLIKETDRFFNENFTGLFRVDFSPGSDGRIYVPLDQTIYFLKLLAVSVQAKTLVNVNYCCNNSNLYIKFSAKGGLPIEGDEMRMLIKAARNAGFEATRIKEGLLLEKSLITVTESVFARIAISAITIREKLYEIFFG